MAGVFLSMLRRRARALAAVALVLIGVCAVTWWHLRAGPGEVQAEARTRAIADIAGELERLQRFNEVAELRTACANEADCSCGEQAADLGLDANLPGPVLTLLETFGATCRDQTRIRGRLAEACARAGKLERARAQVEALERQQLTEAHAAYARAHIAYLQRAYAVMASHAEQAVALRRGPPAHLLLGLARYHLGDLDQAGEQFEAVLEAQPSNVKALYNRALVAHRQDHYGVARGGYLRVLQLDPNNADARYNLAVLTHAAGARQEAQHHYTELRRVVSADDARVRKLRSLFGGSTRPAPSAPQPRISGGPALQP
jgi:tetratricopeptide (TPR) repeat protein